MKTNPIQVCDDVHERLPVAATAGVASKLAGFLLPGSLGILGGVVLMMGMTSCVGPYDGHGYSQYSTYRTGHSVNVLPRGYQREVISGRTYYHHDGHYYQPASQGYVVVEAPRGSRYMQDGRWSQQQRGHDPRMRDRHDPRYQSGTVIRRLPPGYREIRHGGQPYYQSGDRYFRRHDGGYLEVSRPF